MRQYFGTDGIRGKVGVHPMTPDFVLRLGYAAGRVLVGAGRREVLIGKDTRLSGYMFESAMESGLTAAGARVRMLGPLPTPAVAYLTRTFRSAAGIVISASHNPFEDNGIKFFSSDGFKLSDELEREIEGMLDAPIELSSPEELGKVTRIDDASGRYIEYCKSTFPMNLRLDGMRIVLDCANGAGYHVAPNVFCELGAQVHCIGCTPNGTNINDKVGATAPQALAEAVLQHSATLGIALDGDGDRLIMVDDQGQVVDGDGLLFVLARARVENGEKAHGIVGTSMSNLGLEHAITRQLGLEFSRADVGDRYVLERLHERGWLLGGESSGHLLCLDRATTGDGIVAALQVLSYLIQSQQTLREATSMMTRYPQVLINVPCKDKAAIMCDAGVQDALDAATKALGDSGRVLLRPSGTEPKIRVMAEGIVEKDVTRVSQDLANVVRKLA